jgi:hypothetical protein
MTGRIPTGQARTFGQNLAGFEHEPVQPSVPREIPFNSWLDILRERAAAAQAIHF